MPKENPRYERILSGDAENHGQCRQHIDCMTCAMQRQCAHHRGFSLYLELEPLEPVEPEVPELPEEPEEPGDFDALPPDIPDEDVPLDPELWSPDRRSQPAKAMLSAATISNTCDVLTSGFIVAPFTKMDDVSYLTMAVARSSSLFCKH